MTSAKISTNSKRAPLSRLGRVLPWLLVICGVIGTLASVMITIEKFDLAVNPNYQPICNLNPIISCGSVMQSKEASAFGFMNTYIGLIGFPIVVTVGMAMFAGARFKRWFWLGMQVGLTLGLLFAYWLLFRSVYHIKALCPYCLSVDAALTTLWWYVTLWNFQSGVLPSPAKYKMAKMVGRFVRAHHIDLLVLWFMIVTVLIFNHFWYYFGQHL